MRQHAPRARAIARTRAARPLGSGQRLAPRADGNKLPGGSEPSDSLRGGPGFVGKPVSGTDGARGNPEILSRQCLPLTESLGLGRCGPRRADRLGTPAGRAGRGPIPLDPFLGAASPSVGLCARVAGPGRVRRMSTSSDSLAQVTILGPGSGWASTFYDRSRGRVRPARLRRPARSRDFRVRARTARTRAQRAGLRCLDVVDGAHRGDAWVPRRVVAARDDAGREPRRPAAPRRRLPQPERIFTYTVLDPSSRDVIGCVYLYPLPDSDHDACALSWVGEPRSPDTPLWRAVRGLNPTGLSPASSTRRAPSPRQRAVRLAQASFGTLAQASVTAGSWRSPWKTASTLFPSGSMTNAA